MVNIGNMKSDQCMDDRADMIFSETTSLFADTQKCLDFDGSVANDASQIPRTVEEENMEEEPAEEDQLKRMRLKSFGQGYCNSEEPNMERWKSTHLDSWTSEDVMSWVLYLVQERDGSVDRLSLENFRNVSGTVLPRLSRADLERLDANYGAYIYDMYHKFRQKADFNAPADYMLEDITNNVDLCTLENIKSDPGSFHSPYSPHDSVTSAHNPMMSSIDPMPMSIIPRTSSQNPMTSSHNPLTLSINPRTSSAHDPMTSAHNPMTSAHNPMTSSLESMPFSIIPRTSTPHDSMTSLSARHSSPSDFTSTAEHSSSINSYPHSQAPVPVFATNCTPSPLYSPQDPPLPRLAKRGRPRKHPLPDPATLAAKKAGAANRERLWKFIIELLESPNYNPSHICWEKKEEGIFRFVQSEKVAQMWGMKKNNKNMTYEKLSRAMRYCRTSDFFADVPKDQNIPKKLCFKFGPKAKGWQRL